MRNSKLTAGQILIAAIDAKSELQMQKERLINYGFVPTQIVVAQIVHDVLVKQYKEENQIDPSEYVELNMFLDLPLLVVGTEGRFKSRGAYILPMTVTYEQPAFVRLTLEPEVVDEPIEEEKFEILTPMETVAEIEENSEPALIGDEENDSNVSEMEPIDTDGDFKKVTAFEEAKADGFVGTEAEWEEFLNGVGSDQQDSGDEQPKQ